MVDFGDRVRIKTTDETSELELAGLEGDVDGWTTPSVTGVTVIGLAPDDHAVNVYVQGVERDLWFNPQLVELIDHNAGMVAWVDGSEVEAVRLPTGEWQNRPRSNRP